MRTFDRYKRLQKPFLLLLLAGILLLASCDAPPPPVRTGPSPGPAAGQAPDFTLQDVNGQKFRLRDQQGKTTLIVFSTTWCSTCRSEIPYYKELYARFQPKGLVMVGIDILESKSKVSRFASQYQLPYRMLLDETGQVSEAFGVRGVPSLAIVSPDGGLACMPCRNPEETLASLLGK
jgi:peroxiredoxin